MKIREINTGSQCYGYFFKIDQKTFYVNSFEEKIPKKGKKATLSLYDTNFENQLAFMDINFFSIDNLCEAAKTALKRYKEILKTKTHNYQNDFFNLGEYKNENK